MKVQRVIYLDHAAATPLDSRVKAAMLAYLDEDFGNPSAIYSAGRAAKEAVDNARETVARILGCTAAEVIFTGSGTESNNLAIFGVARQNFSSKNLGGQARGHIITANFEHHAVLNPCAALEQEGYAVTYLKVDHDGLITAEQLKAAIRPDTLLVSIMYANNEIGTIEPIAEFADAIREWKKTHDRKENTPPFFHTDACQAAGYLDINVKNLGVDLMTINGSKIYGPKGTGALFVRRGIKLRPIIYGGGQEFGLRSGTENVAGIAGLAKALEIAHETKEQKCKKTQELRDKLIKGILKQIKGVELNGHPTKRLPNNANISIPGVEGEAMLFYLDEYGISAATGSACESAGQDPSHVVQALGKSREAAKSSIRFTIGRATTVEDVEYVLGKLPEIVTKLRKISPVSY